MTTILEIELIACPQCGKTVQNHIVDLSMGDEHSHAECACGWWAVDETFPTLGFWDDSTNDN